MSGLLPAAVYGLEVPAGDVMIPAVPDFPASFRITMAAIDPSAAPEHTGITADGALARATLKLIRQPIGMGDETDSDEDSNEDNYLQKLLDGVDSDEDEENPSTDDEEKNGGPSDPSKSKKARKAAAVEQLKKALAENAIEDDMEVDGPNGVVSKSHKGKGKASGDEDSSEEDDEDSEDLEVEEFVLCTLDPEKHYQQTLDITISEDERVFFKVSGTHTIYLTGNYVIPVDDGHNHEHEVYNEDEDYDLSPDEDELGASEEDDELDALEDPRITEVGSEDEDPPKLIKAEKQAKKGRNKRPVDESDEEPADLDAIIAKSLKPEQVVTNGEPKLSKKQLKKLKNNAGEAVSAAIENKNGKKVDPSSSESPSSMKADKKVQFAKDLEQGPTGAIKDAKSAAKVDTKANIQTNGDKPKAVLGIKTVQGVTIDDKKLGTGPAAKKGDKVAMRYIGKLTDGKVFDANKKGKPFTFKIGFGEVIKGWDIGVAGMSVGQERRITVPASLAYGSKAQPGIPANSQLKFDLKLLSVN